jgi:signal transduction histidine kinase
VCEVSALRLVVLASDAAFSGAIRAVLAAQLPDAATEQVDPGQLRSRPIADGIVIDARTDAVRGAELAARLRAMGFPGALVIVANPDDGATVALTAAGAALAPPDDLARSLVRCLEEQLEQSRSEHATQVMRARRLVAAGEIALRFQHALNNPLAGILAEAQLMQLDALLPEQHAALERIVGLCRRIIELGKSLDGMGERK